ncbi:MAG: hypothetical protein AAF641_15110 [Pseudomonadota bacterium]
MSDPVTNVEIEDVLSSIRRLVSTEPSAQEASDQGAQAPEDGGGDLSESRSEARPLQPKLVLTPAQRVNEETTSRPEEDVTEVDVAEEDVADEGIADEDLADEDLADEDLAEDEAAVEAEDALLDMVADQIASEVEEEAKEHVQAQLAEQSYENRPENDAIEDDTIEASSDAAFDYSDIEDAEVISEDDVSEDDPDAELDRMSGPDVPEFLRRPVTQMDPPEDAEIIADSLAEPEETVAEPQSLTSRAESLEEAVSERAEDWEPDGGDAETLSPDGVEPLPWKEVESEMSDMSPEEAEEDPYSEAEAAQSQPWFGEDAILDEDALRDMVGEIVRQELQGALGERITRNVRKLVRREINRALMSQGLE